MGNGPSLGPGTTSSRPQRNPEINVMATKQPIGRRAAQIARCNPGETHTRPALSVIGPKIKGIRLTADDRIKQAIRELRIADQAEFDTFEEADDFDVPDEIPDPTTQYEILDMEPDTTMEPIVEQKEEAKTSAPKEAPPKEGADEQKPLPASG